MLGIASGTADMLRDFGFTLGPASVGAVALSQATARTKSTVAGSPALRAALPAQELCREAVGALTVAGVSPVRDTSLRSE